MKYLYVPYSNQHWAMDLRKNKDNRLEWQQENRQDVLIIQTPFGETAMDHMDQICRGLEKRGRLGNAYTEVAVNIWVRKVTAQERAIEAGCALHDEACTYTVLAYTEDGDEGRIYAPQLKAAGRPCCDIPLEMKVFLTRDTVVESSGFLGLRKKEKETGFWIMEFPAEVAGKYVNGSLQYTLDDFSIPITREMVEQGTVYIRSGNRMPRLEANSKGIRLI